MKVTKTERSPFPNWESWIDKRIKFTAAELAALKRAEKICHDARNLCEDPDSYHDHPVGCLSSAECWLSEVLEDHGPDGFLIDHEQRRTGTAADALRRIGTATPTERK